MKKTIVLVGKINNNPDVYTYTQSFARALEACNYHVITFNNKKNIFRFNKLNNYYCNYELIKTINTIKPDILFLIKPDNITPKTLAYIKHKYNPIIIGFHPDNPFTFWNGNSHANILASLHIIDYFLCWSKMLIPALQSAGCHNVTYFPFGYDHEIFSPNKNLEILETYTSDVCFVGTWEPEREQWLTHVIKNLPTIKLAIWGNRWQEQLAPTSILHKYIKGPALYAHNMIKVFQESKIVLNFIRQQNITSHNMRTFEVPASRAFILTQRTYEQSELLFQEDENIACFETVDELIKKIAFYLSNDTLRKQMAEKAFAHVQQFTLAKQLDYFMNKTMQTRRSLKREEKRCE